MALAVAGPAWASSDQQAGVTAGSRALFEQVWHGANAAQARHTTACGTLTETRRSPMLARPLVLQGTFCVGGPDTFRLEYRGTNPILVIYNDGALNVSADGGKQTDALDVGDAVRRAQAYFSGPRALQNLERDFTIDVKETADEYTLELLPVAGRFARRLTRVVIGLGKADYLPRRIVIGGKSGVTSTFDIRIDTLDGRLDPSLFRAYRVRPPRDQVADPTANNEARH